MQTGSGMSLSFIWWSHSTVTISSSWVWNPCRTGAGSLCANLEFEPLGCRGRVRENLTWRFHLFCITPLITRSPAMLKIFTFPGYYFADLCGTNGRNLKGLFKLLYVLSCQYKYDL